MHRGKELKEADLRSELPQSFVKLAGITLRMW